MKDYSITFIDNAFDRDKSRSALSDTAVSYDKGIGSMNEKVEVLDRYDDFDSLKINPASYESGPGGGYGIPRRELHGGDDVILPHQKRAALAFLKELRGFGLLADVVGSGKTYEACVVLSELAVRGNINSMLLVVPGQVYEDWIRTLEREFGLGEGALQKVGKNFNVTELTQRGDDEFLHPKKPIIVLDEDFVYWSEEVARNVLFDVIVVDEAHHLCEEEGEMARAMKLLSLMMDTKRRAKKTYCLLLSATPHSGNLAHMFRLWYFIRCKGGNPGDFDEKDEDDRTKDYKKEKRYYHDHICRGAETVMEFIKKVKVSEVLSNYRAEFEAFCGEEEIEALAPGEQWARVDEFLNAQENAAISERVSAAVAGAYHNGVLRSIMIRQPNDRMAKRKDIVNYLFLPSSRSGDVKMKGMNEEPVVLHIENLNGEGAVTAGGENFSLREYVRSVRNIVGYRSEQIAVSQFLSEKVFPALGVREDCFAKEGTVGYYWDQIKELPIEVAMRYVPTAERDEFAMKYPVLKNLLDEHEGERVILFFDYDLRKNEQIAERVEEELKKDKKYAKRLLIGTAATKKETVQKFSSKNGKNSVLLVKDAAFTEGVNLQTCNVIINVQVTPDPLAMDQRIGRIFRLGQQNDVTVYSLADSRTLEGYVLMYFSRIGLMSSNSGDATIIAGSNSERMVTIRCNGCGSVKLLSLEDYEAKRKRDSDDLYCTETPHCRDENERGMKMEEISVYDFKCESCGETFTRSVSEEGYYCMATSDFGRGIMCNSGNRGDRNLYCRKICAVSHCYRFIKGSMKDKCPALKRYHSNKTISDLELMLLCQECPSRAECPAKCRLTKTGAEAINGCADCSESSCSIKPHVIRFDEKWSAPCPVCAAFGRRGRIKPIQARTFATFVRAAWDFKYDGGRAFCANLRQEAKQVASIKDILGKDGDH